MSETSEATAVTGVMSAQAEPRGKSLWSDAMSRFWKDPRTKWNVLMVVFFAVLGVSSRFELIAYPWKAQVGPEFAPPSLSAIPMWFGLDMFGRSVLYKVIHGAQIAMSIGLVTSILSIPIGVAFGAVAGYFGGWLDEMIVWFYSTLSSIPNILLLIGISFALGRGEFAVYVALTSTAWISLARVIRGEFIRHKNREYVIAAASLGASHTSRIFKHILPNVFHFVIIHFSIQFVSAIKSEVILSFLGVGIIDKPSWGTMIDDAKGELMKGVWWQLTFATLAMFFLVRSVNKLGDALTDALDPKLK